MKKQHLFISLLTIACLTGCTNTNSKDASKPGDESVTPTPAPAKDTFVIDGYGIYKFEAENFNADDWIPEVGDAVVNEEKASGGAYLAASARDVDSSCTFNFDLKNYSIISLHVAYAQTEDNLNSTVDLAKTYTYSVENVSNFVNVEGKSVLPARKSATNWEVLDYQSMTLQPGTYKVTLGVLDEIEVGCPSIDYIQFQTRDASSHEVNPSSITEVPENDFHTLPQYQYIMDSDWTHFSIYADGKDHSAPSAIKLKFDEVETASKYYVQVSEKQDFAGAAIKEVSEKSYDFYNAKLGTKYYYRAAASEAGLEAAAVKDITTNDLAPRVVYVPNVLNFRDIGGWATELVPGAKINQGLYFRCAQLNQAGTSSTRSELDKDGKGLAAIKELGIKVDIDMRDSYNVPSKSPADTADWPVELVKASIASGTEPTRWEEFGDVYTLIFNTIAEADEKPVALHCTYGADRTGIATFFLEALLGMSKEDIRRDYVWTKFTQGRDPNPNGELQKWIEKTESTYEGTSFADKMEQHLMTKGISKATLEHIREIFIPGYVAQE